MKAFHCSLIIQVLTFCLGAAQSLPSYVSDSLEVTVSNLGTRQGLSQGMVYNMAQDKTGYIWIATKDGLNRFDGRNFKVYRNVNGDPHSISGSHVVEVYVDSRGLVWSSSYGAGLNLYNPATNGFIRFNRHQGKGIVSAYPKRIFEDAEGNIIVKSNEKLAYHVLMKNKRFPDSLIFDVYDLKDVYPNLSFIVEDTCCTKFLHFTKNGTIWYVNRNKLTVLKKAVKGNYLPSQSFYFNNVEKMANPESRLVFDPKSEHVYAFFDEHMLSKYDGNTNSFKPYIKLPPDLHFFYSARIDQHDRIWLNTEDGGLLQIDLKNAAATVYKSDQRFYQKNDLNDKTISLFDADGNLWLSSLGYGVYKLSARVDLFKKINLSPTEGNFSLHHYRVDRQDAKALFDEGWRKKWIRFQDKIKAEKQIKMPYRIWNNLAQDKEGHTYFWARDLAENSLLIKADLTNNSYRILSLVKAIESTGYAYPIFIGPNSDIWYGEQHSDLGIRLFRIKNKSIEIEEFYFPGKLNRLNTRFITDWHFGDGNYLWLATTQGLFSFDTERKRWKKFINNPDDPNSISANSILVIHPDSKSKNILWIGTEGQGLMLFDTQKGEFRHFDSKAGIPSNVIYSIQEDQKGNFWIGTNNGLYQFNPKTFIGFQFTTEDGLPGNEFNRFQASKSSSGHFYFGGPEGVTIFNPDHFYLNQTPSRLVINELKLQNKMVSYTPGTVAAKGEYSLTKPLEQCTELVFNQDQRMISLSFALLDHIVPTQNRFKYKLDGYDLDWIDAGNGNEAIYTNLDPGEYVFKVIGLNSKNVWSTEPTQLNVTILPYWWNTVWFKALIVLSFFGLLYYLYRIRVSRIFELEKIRNRIAQDLHDEIGSTLSSISLYSATLQKTAQKLNEKEHSILDKIINSTSQMMESINDMVWTVKTDNDSFDHVIDRIRAYAVSVAEVRLIDLSFEVDFNAEKLNLSMEQRKNVYFICKEAINNAIKYSGCDQIKISIRQHKKKNMTIIVADNGRGFDLALDSNDRPILGGNGLKGIKWRAETMGGELFINSTLGKGTEIKLLFKL
jgi:streptogramin lyase/two-component sensor histidine kinase